jgi:Mn2+/Fe2+ NRAMP family transporter
VTPRDLGQSRADTVIAGVLAAFAGIGALVVAAVLFSHHVDASQFQGGAGFAQALRPYIGQWGAAIFSLGLVEAGALAMVTISASTAYAMGEALGRPASFNRKVGEAPWFYATNLGIAVVAAGVVLIPGAPLLSISLNANILAVVLMPVVLVFMLMLANDRELMGPRVNPAWLNLLGGGIAVLIALSGTSYALIAAYNALTGRTGG